jgi:hypothetical protein
LLCPLRPAPQSSAVGFTGVYKVQNVDTGKFMTFYRSDETDTTNFECVPPPPLRPRDSRVAGFG